MLFVTLGGEAGPILREGFFRRLKEYDAHRRDCLAHPERAAHYKECRLGPSADPSFWVDKAEALQEEMATFGIVIR